MFVSQAHSFTQQARLAITLAWVAGYTNILTVITCAHVTSHVSGTTSDLGRQIAEGSWPLAVFSIFLLAAFVLGALGSGVCTEMGRRGGWESIYVLPIAIEAALLAVFAVGLDLYDAGSRQSGFPLYWLTGVASFAMGLQNATITRISSGAVRTTHVTGVLTDLGLETAQFLFWVFDKGRNGVLHPRHELLEKLHTQPTARRLALLASILGSFAVGGGLGALAHAHVARWAMFPPVLFLVWIIHRDLTTPIAEIEPSLLYAAGNETGFVLPSSLALFHLRKERDGHGKVHRMPNLHTWADLLSPTTRVVVLDLGEKSSFDDNAVLELRAVVSRFAATGRRLVISGVGGEHYQQMVRAGALSFLDSTNFCPDLELAIARAIVLDEASSGPNPAQPPARPAQPDTLCA